ncbi:bifunctional diaminohydroxyphosphoribosylaminopyrimidine deaminase/5-amino-6-(5-phosphoribosylamino)uracil reductase RibD [Methylacidimicrobium sp. B4]|uniref:bifunctional diaminohydroxyphosphoribosylaminopyrimidine deaminase/5-amino-6-(5-phosphoribosylamino)uracil reductase RibD n=1 Tax=Methylacidimicrobium sp. B4 TaxID=2796139 RepID=UPI001A8FCD31|nr:bifunctional diaminohydroxyphosphoribosylaminopyrimidine deaminase/5-amino-6-(5-phosphoribosylamino)uracil reductase RibD [Methylacidimicrobium sp. B4]QSR84448.1 bifunctional diaminohydroxyphosphoribosylaminopyrimidine deaminase/5-amino-6-(5-phosphoribosylamino)uracil reductase RibD [Methylacidimicrobium sp. B4]
MRRAIALARRGLGRVSPNPAVGAVLVREGRVLGEGFHHGAGLPHAEVEAIEDAARRGNAPKGATLCVTLEPCSTTGRTPPCVDRIIREGIARVVVGMVDPNPLHRGRGLSLLSGRGIEVSQGLLEEEVRELNRGFVRWITSGRPWVVQKSATSLDGRIGTRPGDSRWLSSPASLRMAHRLRWEADAILIGAETARRDDPKLTVRVPGRKGKRQPWRVVISRSGQLPASLRLLSDSARERTLIFQNFPLPLVLEELGRRGVLQALVEGGGKLAGSLLAEGLIDEVALFLCPTILGEGALSVDPPRPGLGEHFQLRECLRLGDDLFLRGIRRDSEGVDAARGKTGWGTTGKESQ